MIDELSQYISKKIISKSFSVVSIDKYSILIEIESAKVRLWTGNINDNIIYFYGSMSDSVPSIELIINDDEKKDIIEHFKAIVADYEQESLKRQIELKKREYEELVAKLPINTENV